MTGSSCYAGTETGDARMGGESCAEAGCNKTAREMGHRMAGGGGGAGSISLHKNKRWSLGT